MGNVTQPKGIIFMYGSASYLGRSGMSIYARDRTEVAALSLESWRGVRICPLNPLILSECPGSIVRELSELSTWFNSVYDTNPQGLQDVWHGLVVAMDACSTGSALLDIMES